MPAEFLVFSELICMMQITRDVSKPSLAIFFAWLGTFSIQLGLGNFHSNSYKNKIFFWFGPKTAELIKLLTLFASLFEYCWRFRICTKKAVYIAPLVSTLNLKYQHLACHGNFFTWGRFIYILDKAELSQVGILFGTQFSSLGIFINKKVGFWKN